MDKVPAHLADVTVASWTVTDVVKWLENQGFPQDLRDLFATQEIDGYSLLRINEHDLHQPPMNLSKLGIIKHLIGAIQDLRSTTIAKVDITQPGMPVAESSATVPRYHASVAGTVDPTVLKQLGVTMSMSSDGGGAESSESDDDADAESREPHERSPVSQAPSQHRRLPPLKPEIGKAILACCYFLGVTVATSFVMVIVHDRVPDMEKYPPLPDFFLDNIPLIPWAFDLCEVAGFLLALIWTCVLIAHKHRFILLRRFFVLMGTIFLLRSVCMLITSMSVPGRHLKCAGKSFGDSESRLRQALVIAKGLGMSIRGVRTCGDYMFSGHTVVITVLNHFITECIPDGSVVLPFSTVLIFAGADEKVAWFKYISGLYDTSKRYRLIHLTSWTLNLFGMFFILAAHEHYSIDVFIAFYISSRLFLYYHTMANTDILRRHPRRANLYFPLYAFFEAEVYRVVPNEYEWPFSMTWPYVHIIRADDLSDIKAKLR